MLYLDLCCLSRPFDDQNQLRVRLEAEAILGILQSVQDGHTQLLSSDALEYEIGRNPDPDRQEQVRQLLALAHHRAPLGQTEWHRARVLTGLGFTALDALHAACAEVGGATVLLTTDDRFIRCYERNRAALRIRIQNPVRYLEEN